MGTRNLICVVEGGKYRVAQYGQWDGYPSGQGMGVLNFLRNNGTKSLQDGLRWCRWLTQCEERKRWAEFGVDIDANSFVKMDIADRFYNRYPELSRDTGSKILHIVANADAPLVLSNEHDFAYDSLFCEWAYVIDLDKRTFEVYEGFNKKPLDKSERFYTENIVKNNIGETYYPVRLKTSYSLDDLPDEETFLKDNETEDE